METPTTRRGRQRIEGIIDAEDILERQRPGYLKQVKEDIKRMMAPGYRPIICTGGYLFPPPPMFRSKPRNTSTFDEGTERFLAEQFDDLFPTKKKKRHLPLLEQRDIALREALGTSGANKRIWKRVRKVHTDHRKTRAA